MENSPDHVNLKLNKHRFNVILRAKGDLKVPELANSRNLLGFSDLLTEDNICFMQMVEMAFRMFMSHPMT